MVINMSNAPIWFPNENIIYSDDNEFLVIIIDNKYFPIGRFTGHLTLSGCQTLNEAKAFSKQYYKTGDNNVPIPSKAA